MYSFRKDFGDRRERIVKDIPGYKELTGFFERSTNIWEFSQPATDFIGKSDVTLSITQKPGERIKGIWENLFENDITVSNSEEFSDEYNAEDFTKIIIYILRRDNLNFVIRKNSVSSKGSIFIVNFSV